VHQKFVARQPIFDREENVYGYELLFRSGLENCFTCNNPDLATTSVIVDSFLLFGIETLTSGRYAFLNFTDDLILKKYATLLPNQQVVIEILESVNPNTEIVNACKFLKSQGYRLALDDFEYQPDLRPLIVIADLIKVDIQKTPLAQWGDIHKNLPVNGAPLLAEKVETREQFREARELGFQYFQGFFFGQPETFATKEIQGCKLNYLQMVKEINEEQPDFKKIEDLVQREPMLCYKLFRFLNSPIFAFSREIKSIHHALILLGINEVRKWISVVALSAMGANKPSALMTALIIRAKFCEKLSPLVKKDAQSLEFFLMGLLSMIETILDSPRSQILNQVAASPDVKAALLEGSGPLKPVLDLVVATEKGAWQEISHLSAQLDISEEALMESYMGAIKWGNEILQIDKN
jgi:c-di-GMP-related signal transduction protein